jgi:hypothetical protein
VGDPVARRGDLDDNGRLDDGRQQRSVRLEVGDENQRAAIAGGQRQTGRERSRIAERSERGAGGFEDLASDRAQNTRRGPVRGDNPGETTPLDRLAENARGGRRGEDARRAGARQAVGDDVGDGQRVSASKTGRIRSSAFVRLASELA